MIAIITKYLGPSDYRGSRVKAFTDQDTRIVDWDHALSMEKNHDRAAVALCQKMGWKGTLVRGGIKHGYAYVFATYGQTGMYSGFDSIEIPEVSQ